MLAGPFHKGYFYTPNVICTPNTGHPVLGVHIIDIEPSASGLYHLAFGQPLHSYTEDKDDFEIPVEDEPKETDEEDNAEE